MRFHFSPLTTLVTLGLALGMVCASVWQWNRHVQKQQLVERLEQKLLEDPISISQLLLSSSDISQETWRRVRFSGEYDFQHEMIVRRNRGPNDRAGFHVITPLALDNNVGRILIDRGFIPLGREEKQHRTHYQSPNRVDLIGLIKNSMPQKFLAPSDPSTGPDKPWVDLWLRVDIEKMSKQLPYPVLPIYLEIMEDPHDPSVSQKIVKESSAGRNEVLSMTGGQSVDNLGMESPDVTYPIPLFDTTPPPDIHLGYVYEWAFMALITLGIGIIKQFKRF